jgi:hypothetical protein
MATTESNWWEIADRRHHLDHVPPDARPAVQALRTELLGPPSQRPGKTTGRFLGLADGLKAELAEAEEAKPAQP